jgi:hypothetical protein
MGKTGEGEFWMGLIRLRGFFRRENSDRRHMKDLK